MSEAKNKLLNTALQLFLDEGLHSVGIDRVIKVSGVSKMTLYKYFPSKDILIEHVLALYHGELLVELAQSVAGDQLSLEQQLFSLLNWYKGRFLAGPQPRGCLFASAANMYPDKDHPVHRVCLMHKGMLIDLFATLLKSHGYEHSPMLALQCLILFEGAQNLTAIGVQGDAIDAATLAMLALLRSSGPAALTTPTSVTPA